MGHRLQKNMKFRPPAVYVMMSIMLHILTAAEFKNNFPAVKTM